MNSIRPLVTITILVVAGAFLYVKINEGPERQSPDASEAWQYQPLSDVPPLAAASPAASATEGAAPAGPTAAIDTAPPPMVSAVPVAASPAAPPLVENSSVGADTAAAPPAVPAVPAMPALPEISPPPQSDTPTTAAIPIPTQLPANIPTAQYPDQVAAAGTTVPADVVASTTPPTPAASTAVEPVVPPVSPAPIPSTPEAANAAGVATAESALSPLAAQPNPLRERAEPAAEVDRYASATPAPTQSTTNTASAPVEPTFVESWPTIQATLNRGDLARAHQLLSRWYDDPSLTPTDAERVESLLSQLAGTVVYSTEHQLAPAYVVKQGETLETIAKEYSVPWQLLAKINGIPAADQVRPGQELKVVRGPFSAVVDLARKQITLMVDGRYAGKFPVSVRPGNTVSDGQWVVERKHIAPAERAIVLQRDAAAPGTAAPTLVIAGAPLTANFANTGALIHVSAKDAEELSDILSVGSRVVTRR